MCEEVWLMERGSWGHERRGSADEVSLSWCWWCAHVLLCGSCVEGGLIACLDEIAEDAGNRPGVSLASMATGRRANTATWVGGASRSNTKTKWRVMTRMEGKHATEKGRHATEKRVGAGRTSSEGWEGNHMLGSIALQGRWQEAWWEA